MKSHPDKERNLVALIGENQQEATKEIYGAYSGYVTGVCARFLSDDDDLMDVAQDIFIKIFTSLKSFRYSGEGSLKAWIGRISVNCVLNYLRDNNKIIFTRPTVDLTDIADEPPDTESLTSDELAMLIRALPDGYRTVFNLYAIEGRPHKEIAKLLGIKENSSASQYLRAKALLAVKIKDYLKRK